MPREILAWGNTLLKRSVIRNRFKLLLVAVLLLGAILMQVLYSSRLLAKRSQSLILSDEPFSPYFDLMVVLEHGDEMIPIQNYPWFLARHGGNQRANTLLREAQVIRTTVNSVAGDLELISMNPIFEIPEKLLQGRTPRSDDELLLPLSYANRASLNLGQEIVLGNLWDSRYTMRSTFTIVGIYDDSEQWHSPAKATRVAVSLFTGSAEPNCVLIRVSIERRLQSLVSDISILELTDYMSRVYPKGTFLSSYSIVELRNALHNQREASSTALVVLFRIFLFVSLTTVALLDFQKRRREFASLKCVGMSIQQVISFYLQEHLIAFFAAFGVGVIILSGFKGVLPWLSYLDLSSAIFYICQAALYTFMIQLLALLLPLFTVCIANVTQLIFARNIPLHKNGLDHLQTPTGSDVLREIEENLRLLKLPFGVDAVGLMFFKSLGDGVKRGETIAAQESVFGFVINEWLAFCDGTIVELSESGTVAIRPTDDDESFYPYAEHLRNSGIKTRQAVLRGASMQKKLGLERDAEKK
jgi:hypothetical protein